MAGNCRRNSPNSRLLVESAGPLAGDSSRNSLQISLQAGKAATNTTSCHAFGDGHHSNFVAMSWFVSGVGTIGLFGRCLLSVWVQAGCGVDGYARGSRRGWNCGGGAGPREGVCARHRGIRFRSRGCVEAASAQEITPRKSPGRFRRIAARYRCASHRSPGTPATAWPLGQAPSPR